MIDTMPAKSHSFKIKESKEEGVPVLRRHQTEDEINQKSQVDRDLRKKGQEIFGDQEDQNRVQPKGDVKTTSSASLKGHFNSDEIDDPFNTEADQKIAETDIPERL